jgi:lysophospholipase L1-like esterase
MRKYLLLFLCVLFILSTGNHKMTKIIFAGDSITMGAWTNDSDGDQLTGLDDAQKFSHIIGAAKGFDEIINAGRSGNNTADLLARLQTDVINQNPDMVVIMIGRNDVREAQIPETPVATYRAELTEIVQRLQAAGIGRILLLSWNPMDVIGGWQEINSPAYIAVMSQVAAENGIYFIDINSMWTAYKFMLSTADYSALYNDPTHPSALGHRVIASFVLQPYFNFMFGEEHYSLTGENMLALTAYDPPTMGGYTTTTTLAEMDTAHLSVSFIAPESGRVLVRLTAQAYLTGYDGNLVWGLRSGQSVVGVPCQVTGHQPTNEVNTFSRPFPISGLIPGTEYTLAWCAMHSNAAWVNRWGGGVLGCGAAVMEVWAVP